jgi:uncharacterized protein (DUF3084 family)
MAQIDEPQRSAPVEIDAIEAERRRLQALVGDLLKTNQELRFKVARLEQHLSETTTVYRMLAP